MAVVCRTYSWAWMVCRLYSGTPTALWAAVKATHWLHTSRPMASEYSLQNLHTRKHLGQGLWLLKSLARPITLTQCTFVTPVHFQTVPGQRESNTLTAVELNATLLRRYHRQSLLRWSQACCLLHRWTSGLLNRVLHKGNVVMRIDGPYGEFAEHPEWTHYKTLVIIAGGIGVGNLQAHLHKHISPYAAASQKLMSSRWQAYVCQ